MWDVGYRMHSLSIVVLQVHAPEHSLKQCIYYLTRFLCVRNPGAAYLPASHSGSLKGMQTSQMLGLWSPQGWTHTGGCRQRPHPHWLLADDICSLPYGPLHGAPGMAGGLPQS